MFPGNSTWSHGEGPAWPRGQRITFKFSGSPKPLAPFDGKQFFAKYRESEFLKDSANIEQILSRGHELRHTLKTLTPGQSMDIEGMFIIRNILVSIKKCGLNDNVGVYDFTFNRLSGLVAAYTFENRRSFKELKSSDAIALGLEWDGNDKEKAKLYLSAAPGAEHFIQQFSYYPLVCALRKYQLKKMPIELVVKMAKIKNDDGVPMACVLNKDGGLAERLWKRFNDTKTLKELVKSDGELKRLFIIK